MSSNGFKERKERYETIGKKISQTTKIMFYSLQK